MRVMATRLTFSPRRAESEEAGRFSLSYPCDVVAAAGPLLHGGQKVPRVVPELQGAGEEAACSKVPFNTSFHIITLYTEYSSNFHSHRFEILTTNVTAHTYVRVSLSKNINLTIFTIRGSFQIRRMLTSKKGLQKGV
jgi:hypothetical protein